MKLIVTSMMGAGAAHQVDPDVTRDVELVEGSLLVLRLPENASAEDLDGLARIFEKVETNGRKAIVIALPYGFDLAALTDAQLAEAGLARVVVAT